MHAQNITGDKLQKSWEKQLHSVERIVRLVEQLLDVSRIDGAPMAFDAECFAVKGVLVDLVQRFGDMAKKAGCSLMLHGNPEAVVVWDRDRFDQIMSNLLSNAIKYAPHAPIHLEWTQGPDALSVSVRDHGPGIAAQDQERVFCRYERLNSSSRSSQGLGLGLWISRKIVESAGGSLRLDSQPERGSTFSLTLPQHQSADIAVTSAA
jgi:signal transduction histidine kinase